MERWELLIRDGARQTVTNMVVLAKTLLQGEPAYLHKAKVEKGRLL